MIHVKHFEMKNIKLVYLLILIITVSSCKFFKQQKMFDKDEEMLEVIEPVVETPVADTVEIETIEQETEPVVVAQEPKAPTEGYGSDRFYMVVGSFLSENFAHKYAKAMVDQGYQPQVIHSNITGFYRVSAKSYSDYKVAIGEIENFRNTVTPRAWVHVKK